MKIGTPSEIYKKVTHDIESIIYVFKSKKYNDVKYEEIEQAITRLEEMKSKLSLELEMLNDNAEWDVFNIAFYGETNAGKSTLIETLRIILNEPTKVCQREAFDFKKNEAIDVEKKITKHCKLVEEINDRYSLEIKILNEKADLIKTDICEIEKDIQCFEEEIINLKKHINEKKKSSVINFFLYIVGILKEQQILSNLENSIQNSSFTLNQLILECDKLEIQINSKSEEMNLELEKMEGMYLKIKENQHRLNQELMHLSDGLIIGDGQSDFTRDVKAYKFSRHNQDYVLLDLPGIEGKEELVTKEIDSAVKKAHVVFYITNKAAPPQNGGDAHDGTLQKIKKHLGQHTEVFSIYNKRVKNPKQLIPGLINEDERKSLVELETTMKENLGDHYSGNKLLTAYPAFLSIGKTSYDTFLKAQEKFLKNYDDYEKLLSETYVDRFSNWLISDIVTDCKNKIIKSNYRKVSVRLNDTEMSIRKICDELITVKKLLEKTRRGTVSQLDESTNTLITNLHNAVTQGINCFKKSIREKIYLEIEKDINGRTFKEKYKEILEKALTELEVNQTKSIESALDSYKKDIERIIEKHNRYESELLDAFSKQMFLNLDNIEELNLKGFLNWKKAVRELVLVIGSLIVGLFTPVGWVAIAFSILGAIVSVSKNLINIFDKNKRMAYQKSIANKSIDKTSTAILDSIIESINESNNQLIVYTEKFKQDIRKPTRNLDSMICILNEASEKVGLLKSTIIREGVNYNENN